MKFVCAIINHITTFESSFSLSMISLQDPGYIIASLGASIEISQSCFESLTKGTSASPILLAGDGSRGSAPPFLNGPDNFVDDGWDCNLVSTLGESGTTTCGSDIAMATSCQSSCKELTCTL